MNVLTKIIFCIVVCVVALVSGRTIVRALATKGAASYGYSTSLDSSSLQSSGVLSTTQELQSGLATPVVLSPRPIVTVAPPTVVLTVTVSVPFVSTPSIVASATHAAISTATEKPVKPTVSPTQTVLASATVSASPSPTQTVLASATVSTSATTAAYTEYTVKKGDTLLGIAKTFNTTARAILDLNKDITSPSQLRIGQVLRIPSENTN